MYECRGRIQGDYPIHIPKDSLLAEKIMQETHGGVSLTMAEVRKNCWIPKLRGLTKNIRRDCFGCKRFQITAFANPPRIALPLNRTVETEPFN